MATPEKAKPKAGELESEQQDLLDNEQASERAEQGDLDQGMETGTHSSTRHGVKWGAAFKNQVATKKPEQTDPEKK